MESPSISNSKPMEQIKLNVNQLSSSKPPLIPEVEIDFKTPYMKKQPSKHNRKLSKSQSSIRNKSKKNLKSNFNEKSPI